MNLLNDAIWLVSVGAAVLTLMGLYFPRMLVLRFFLLGACLCGANVAWQTENKVIFALLVLAALINAIRIFQIHNISRRIRHIRHYGYDTTNIARFMKPVSFPAGTVIFEKDDPADRLYLVRSGTIGISNGAKVEKDSLLGEVGIFTKAGKRSMGASALSDVEALTLSSEEVGKLCLNEPEFSYALSQIMATRMAENMERVNKATRPTA